MYDMKITNENTAEVDARIRICRGNYFQTSLDLSDMGLAHIPEALKELDHLEVLKLNENNLANLPDFFGSFKYLKFLDLGCNRLAALPDTLGGLTLLETLNVRCNELTSIPESIGNLCMLTTLDCVSAIDISTRIMTKWTWEKSQEFLIGIHTLPITKGSS